MCLEVSEKFKVLSPKQAFSSVEKFEQILPKGYVFCSTTMTAGNGLNNNQYLRAKVSLSSLLSLYISLAYIRYIDLEVDAK